MAGMTRCAPCAARAMLWDRKTLSLQPVTGGRNLLALRLADDGPHSDTITAALNFAGFTVMPIASPLDLLTRIKADRPDLVVLPSSTAAPQCLLDRIEIACMTETLPVLFNADTPIDREGCKVFCDTVATGTNFEGLVLVARALMRRVRPWCLTQTRVFGGLQLCEARFQISAGGRIGALGKLDFNILGCLFDAPDYTFDRETLMRLAIGRQTTRSGARLIDVKICATRHLLKSALGFDPILTVRGVGYQLAQID